MQHCCAQRKSPQNQSAQLYAATNKKLSASSAKATVPSAFDGWKACVQVVESSIDIAAWHRYQARQSLLTSAEAPRRYSQNSSHQHTIKLPCAVDDRYHLQLRIVIFDLHVMFRLNLAPHATSRLYRSLVTGPGTAANKLGETLHLPLWHIHSERNTYPHS